MFGGTEGKNYLKKENDWAFFSSSCGVLEKKAHLVQPYHFTEEEHGNLGDKVSNPRFIRKLVIKVVLAVHWEIISPSKTKVMIYIYI